MYEIEIWALIPFVLMLLSIAVLPLAAPKWWESNLHKLCVAVVLALPAGIYLVANGMGDRLEHQMLYDYLPFIILLCSLFVVTGGIDIRGDIEATPRVNTLILAIGFLLASFMGTTGAAMLLIRFIININKQRTHKTHTILFFIALIANCGGVLTPLGDPPLFLLYLRGAHFTWFLSLLPEWLFTGTVLLAIYYLTDRYFHGKEPSEALRADRTEVTKLRLSGGINIVYLAAVIAAVSFVNQSYIPSMADENAPLYVKFLREIVLVVIILLSVFTTDRETRRQNNFTWDPIIEVGFLFIGIFATMTPALLFLNTHAAKLGLHQPWQFFYGAGSLSAFLDNAPTAVAFHTVAQGLPQVPDAVYVAGIPQALLKAIALGSVFFGSMTYIGNGPNFMVKAIAEQSGIKMPGFFGYMVKFSLVVLLPVYVVTQLIFLH